MQTALEFDYKKAVQAINFFAQQEGGKIDKLKVIKLIYLADRYHLRKYGRPIVNDSYLAMPYGPVGSSVKDIAEFSNFLAPEEIQYAINFISPGGGYFIQSNKETDQDVFSDSDLESLEFVCKEFGKNKQFNLVEITHKYPEWARFENALNSRETTREQMDYNDFFLDPKGISSDPFKLSQEELENSKKILGEAYKTACLWQK